MVLAIDRSNRRVVGYTTAISDGVSCAYIPHLEVLREYRSRGIGSQLIRRLVQKVDQFYMVDLICDESLRAFYEPLGFLPLTGMARRNYLRQSCE